MVISVHIPTNEVGVMNFFVTKEVYVIDQGGFMVLNWGRRLTKLIK